MARATQLTFCTVFFVDFGYAHGLERCAAGPALLKKGGHKTPTNWTRRSRYHQLHPRRSFRDSDIVPPENCSAHAIRRRRHAIEPRSDRVVDSVEDCRRCRNQRLFTNSLCAKRSKRGGIFNEECGRLVSVDATKTPRPTVRVQLFPLSALAEPWEDRHDWSRLESSWSCFSYTTVS